MSKPVNYPDLLDGKSVLFARVLWLLLSAYTKISQTHKLSKQSENWYHSGPLQL
jgi:type VI protein secretion system component VasA